MIEHMEKGYKICFLDAATVGEDISFDALKGLGEVVLYDYTSPEEVFERVADCDVVITNKVKLFEQQIDASKNLKLICVAATGVNCVDTAYAAQKGIPVKNIPAYSTESVSQVIFMHILNLVGHGIYFNEYVHSGAYSKSGVFTEVQTPFFELKGKNMGIIGLGNIGKRVAELAKAFGMRVSYYSTSGTSHCKDYPSISLEDLLAQSDIVSINCPLNQTTKNLLNYDNLSLMKPSAYLINASRGGIVNEVDLVKALNDGLIAGAAVDAFEVEPIPADHPYISQLKDSSKLVLSPHIGWTSREARTILMEILVRNIEDYIATGR